MTETLKKAWSELISPLLRRPKRLQVAALCYKETKGEKKVLLITSRGTGRWVIPKGWPMAGKNASEAAMQEAWEEAGVKKGKIAAEAIGHYDYDKELKTGLPVPVETLVFPIEVEELRDEFPEASERERRWVSLEEASNMVREPRLKALMRDF